MRSIFLCLNGITDQQLSNEILGVLLCTFYDPQIRLFYNPLSWKSRAERFVICTLLLRIRPLCMGMLGKGCPKSEIFTRMSDQFLSLLWPPQTRGWNGRIRPCRSQNRQKWPKNAKNENRTFSKVVDFGQTSVLKVVEDQILSGKMVSQAYFE